jgi:hypothetical protein
MASQDGFVALLGGGSGSAKNGSGWNRVFGDNKPQDAVSVSVGKAFGEITVVGNFDGITSFGSPATTITSAGGYDIFVAQFLGDGTPTSAQKFGDAEAQLVTAMTTDIAGNFFISGAFKGTLSFGSGSVMTAQSTNNAYLVKFDSSTTYQWSKSFGGDNFYGSATDISVDAASNVFLVGAYQGNIDFGGGPIASKGTTADLFLAKLTSAGQSLWNKTFNDGSGVFLGRMKLSPAMEPVIAGFVANSTNFGTGQLAPVGSNDGFVAKFAP